MAEKFKIAAFLKKAKQWCDLEDYNQAEKVITYWTLLIATKKANGDLIFKCQWPKIPSNYDEAIQYLKDGNERIKNDYPDDFYVLVVHEIDRWDFEWVTYFKLDECGRVVEIQLTEDEEEDDGYFTGKFSYINDREKSFYDIITRYWTIESCVEENGEIVWQSTLSAAFKNSKKDLIRAIDYVKKIDDEGNEYVYIFTCHKITRNDYIRSTFYKLKFDGNNILKEKVKIKGYGIKKEYKVNVPDA